MIARASPLDRALPGLDLSAKGYIVDLDGTLISGGQPLLHTHALLEAIRGRFAIVSNDAEHTSPQLATILKRAGLDIGGAPILLAGEVTLDVLARERPGADVLMIASTALRRHAQRQGLRPVARGGDIVFVGRDRTFSYEKIALAAAAVTRGAELVVANPDGSHPGPDGSPVPETGALAAAILACAGDRPHRVIGKPHPLLFEQSLDRLGCTPSEAIVIGDNPKTDGAGAATLSIRFQLVHPVHTDAG